MKKRKTLLLGAALLVLAALVVAGFVLPPQLARSAWERIAARTSERLGRAVQAESVDFVPFSPLYLRGVEVAGEPGERPLLRVDEIEVDVDTESLVFGPPRLRHVRIRGLHITAELDERGLPRLHDLPARLSEGRNSGEGGRAEGPPRRWPDLTIESGTIRLSGPGLAAYRGMLPAGQTLDDEVVLDGLSLTALDSSLIAEEQVFGIEGRCRASTLGRSFLLHARFAPGEDHFRASFEGDRPLRYGIAGRWLDVGQLSFDSREGLSVDNVALYEEEDEGERLVVRVRSVGIHLADSLAESADSGLLGAIMSRIARVDLEEPEVFLAHGLAEQTPIDVLQERLYLDDLDARIDEVHEDGAAARPARGRKRTLKPNGERLRTAMTGAFGKLGVGADSLISFVHQIGSRLPVRAVHIRKGRLLYEDVSVEDTRVSSRLYNLYIDVERTTDDQVFTFDMRFETPEAEQSKNLIEGRIHLGTRDLEMRARINELPLERYRALLPPALRSGAGATVYNTDLTVRYVGEKRQLRCAGQVFLRDLEIRHPPLAPEPLRELRLGAELGLIVDLAKERLLLEKSALYLGDVKLEIGADVEGLDEAPIVDLHLALPRSDVMDIVRSVPPALVPNLRGVEMTGQFGFTADLRVDTANLETLDYEIEPDASNLRVISMGEYVDLQEIRDTFVHEVVERDGTVTRFRVGPGASRWTPLDQISPYIIAALTTTEDGSFFRHDGFSPSQIRRSLIVNLETGRFQRGASTLSQQLVKNLFLTRDKTIARKLQEAFITWQLEKHLTKERILELYLNIIEWGPYIYGITEASRHYFGKRPSELTLLDAVFLVSIIPNPRRFHHQFERGEVTPRWRDRLRRIIDAMVARGRVSAAEGRAARPYSPVFVGRRPTPSPAANRPEPTRAPAAPPVEDSDIPLPGGH